MCIRDRVNTGYIKISTGPGTWKKDIFRATTFVPVSYTHLDVYKRQVYGQIGQTEYIINKVKEDTGMYDAKVVVTGGLGRITVSYTHLDVYKRQPQESEQLSKYVSDDTYVKQQKEDIEELATCLLYTSRFV